MLPKTWDKLYRDISVPSTPVLQEDAATLFHCEALETLRGVEQTMIEF